MTWLSSWMRKKKLSYQLSMFPDGGCRYSAGTEQQTDQIPSAEDAQGFAKSATTAGEGSWLSSIGKPANITRRCVDWQEPLGDKPVWFPRQELGSMVGQGKHRLQRKPWVWSPAAYFLAVHDGTSPVLALMVEWTWQQQCLSQKALLKAKGENAWKALSTLPSWLGSGSPGTGSETSCTQEGHGECWGRGAGEWRKQQPELGLQYVLNKGLGWTHRELWSWDNPSELSYLEARVFIYLSNPVRIQPIHWLSKWGDLTLVRQPPSVKGNS